MCRSITAKDFITTVKRYLEKHQDASAMLMNVIACKRDGTIKDIILRLDAEKRQGIYVADIEENLEGVITQRYNLQAGA